MQIMVKRNAYGRLQTAYIVNDASLSTSRIEKVVIEVDGERYECIRIIWENSYFTGREYILSVLTPETEVKFLKKGLYFDISCNSETIICYYGEKSGSLVEANLRNVKRKPRLKIFQKIKRLLGE